jgi:transcription elongation factor Elf1
MINASEIVTDRYQPIFPESIPVLPEFACPACGNNDSSKIYATPIGRNNQGHLVGGNLRCGHCGLEYAPADEDCPDRD